MPALLVVALVVAVIWAAGRAPSGGTTSGAAATIPGAHDFVVPGGGLSGPLSPAMQGGQPSVNADNNLLLSFGTPVPPTVGPQVYGSSFRADAINTYVRGSLVPPPLAPLPSAQIPARTNLTVLTDPRYAQNKV